MSAVLAADLIHVEIAIYDPRKYYLYQVTVDGSLEADPDHMHCEIKMQDGDRAAVQGALDAAGIRYAFDRSAEGETTLELFLSVMPYAHALQQLTAAFAGKSFSNPLYEYQMLVDGRSARFSLLAEDLQPIDGQPHAMFLITDIIRPMEDPRTPEQWQQYLAALADCELVEQAMGGYGAAMVRLTPAAAVDYTTAISQIVNLFPR